MDSRRTQPPRRTRLWLVRHAQSVGNVDGSHGDTDLTEEGRRQAETLGESLRAERFDHVLSSPLLRARRTAEVALRGTRVTEDPELRELVVQKDTFIDVASLSREDLLNLVSPSQDEFETGPDFVARVRQWLAALPRDRTTLAFTHFAVVRECLRQCGTRPLPQHIDYCSVHRVALPPREG